MLGSSWLIKCTPYRKWFGLLLSLLGLAGTQKPSDREVEHPVVPAALEVPFPSSRLRHACSDHLRGLKAWVLNKTKHTKPQRGAGRNTPSARDALLPNPWLCPEQCWGHTSGQQLGRAERSKGGPAAATAGNEDAPGTSVLRAGQNCPNRCTTGMGQPKQRLHG